MTSHLISTKTKSNEPEELFLAVYFNDIKKVIEIKNKFPEIYAEKDKFSINENITVDLKNLTFFNQTIWFNQDWTSEIKPLIKKQRKRTEKMIAFWQKETGREKIQRQIEYNNYHEIFYCDDPNDFDEITLEPISSYLEKGFREIDLKLFNRAQCFDFKEVKKLLNRGAKPDIDFEKYGNSCIFSRIYSEYSYLLNCQVIPEFEMFETKGYNQNFNILRMFGDLLGLAAHEDMYHLLEKYVHEA